MSSINPEIEKAEAEKRAEESERLRLRQEREMNKYAAPRSAPRARPTTLTKAYLEDDFIDDADEDYDAGATGYGSEDEGYGGSATDRARAALGGGRRRQLDDREEVSGKDSRALGSERNKYVGTPACIACFNRLPSAVSVVPALHQYWEGGHMPWAEGS